MMTQNVMGEKGLAKVRMFIERELMYIDVTNILRSITLHGNEKITTFLGSF